jgi:hypothetical protein
MDDDVRLEVDERTLNGLRYALTKMDKDSNTQLRNDVADITSWYAPKLANAALGLGSANNPAQALRVAQSIRAVRDRTPYVRVGGRSSRFSGGAVAGQVLYGSEFGSNNYKQFPARSPKTGRGNAGWWIYPSLKRFQPEITYKWKEAVMKVLGNW